MKCKVIKAVEGWNVGDYIEADGERLDELLNLKIVQKEVVEVLPVPDEVREVLADVVEVVKKKSKKGVK